MLTSIIVDENENEEEQTSTDPSITATTTDSTTKASTEAQVTLSESHSHLHTHINKKPRFEVRKWTAVAFWSWDIIVESCAICRNHLMEPCIGCQPNSMNKNSDGTGEDECITVWGACNHAFHMHCISRWLKTRPVCPLDNKEWVFQKYGK